MCVRRFQQWPRLCGRTCPPKSSNTRISCLVRLVETWAPPPVIWPRAQVPVPKIGGRPRESCACPSRPRTSRLRIRRVATTRACFRGLGASPCSQTVEFLRLTTRASPDQAQLPARMQSPVHRIDQKSQFGWLRGVNGFVRDEKKGDENAKLSSLLRSARGMVGEKLAPRGGVGNSSLPAGRVNLG